MTSSRQFVRANSTCTALLAFLGLLRTKPRPLVLLFLILSTILFPLYPHCCQWTSGREVEEIPELLVVYPRFSRSLVETLLEVVDLWTPGQTFATSFGRVQFYEGLSSCRLPSFLSKKYTGRSVQLLFVLPDPIDLVSAFYINDEAARKKSPAVSRQYWPRDYVERQTAAFSNIYNNKCINQLQTSTTENTVAQFSRRTGSSTVCCAMAPSNALLEGLYASHILRWTSELRSTSRHLSTLSVHYHDILQRSQQVAEQMSAFFNTNQTRRIRRCLDNIAKVGSSKSSLLVEGHPETDSLVRRSELDMATHSRLTAFFEIHKSSLLSVRAKLRLAAMDQEEWKNRLSLAASRLAVNRTLVVVFCEKTYLSILINWLAFYRLHSKSCVPVLVITTDQQFSQVLAGKGVNSLYLSAVPSANLAASFWKTRLYVFIWLSKWNFTVIHSDVDAIWLKDPIPEIYNRLGRGHDHGRFLFSRDIYPKEQLDAWGTTLCTGFMAFRGGRRTVAFWKFVVKLFVRYVDDQRSLNQALFRMNLAWPVNSTVMKESDRFDQWVCGHTQRGISACLMPMSFARRQCMAHSREYNLKHTVVIHCHGSKHGGLKEITLRKRHLWLLPHNLKSLDTLSKDVKMKGQRALDEWLKKLVSQGKETTVMMDRT